MTTERQPNPEPRTAQTKSGRLLLMAGLTFHSGRRLADSPELIAAIEQEAAAAARAEVARQVRELPGYRDPRYSGRWESKGIVDRAAVLAILDADPREEPEPSAWNIDADGMPHGPEWWHGYTAALDADPREEPTE